MSGLQPPGVPVFYPGYTATTQFNSGMDGSGGIRDTWTFINNKPKFKARRVAAQTGLTEGTNNWMVWDTIIFDTYNGWGPSQSPAQSADKYIVQVSGWYLITGRVSLSGTGASGLVIIPEIGLNGSSPVGHGSPGWEGTELFVPTGGSTSPKCGNSVWTVYAPAGATIQLGMWYSTESTITSTDATAGFQPELSLVWIRK